MTGRAWRAGPALAAGLLAGALVSCSLFGEGNPAMCQEGPCTETGNPNIAGIVKDTLGRPVPGAELKLFKLAGRPGDDSAALLPPHLFVKAASAGDGTFRFDSLPAGWYALEGAHIPAGTIALAPGLPVADSKVRLTADLLLKRPGRLSGVATRGSNPLPAGTVGDEMILVRMVGTDRFTRTDTAGRYFLENIPEGVYRMAFAAEDGHYLPAYRDSITVPAGGDVIVPKVELEWSPFVNPPVPSGLQARSDSSAGVIRLRWGRVRVANLAHYELTRRDSLDPGHDSAFATPDTAFADSVKMLPLGTWLTYTVRAVTRLGNKSPAGPATPPVAVPPDTATPKEGELAGIVLDGNLPAAARVRLYALPIAPGSPDSLPLPVQPVDSVNTGIDGRFRFARLAGKAYSLEAAAAGRVALRIRLAPRPAPAPPETLHVETAGTVAGKAGRGSIWVTTPYKLDENIRVTLDGAPYEAVTDPMGDFRLAGVPPGSYRAVYYALPVGFFLADTVAVTVRAGETTVLSKVTAHYNPALPPPKPAGLRLLYLARDRVDLEWNPLPASYADLKRYEVIRMDSSLRVLTVSQAPAAAFSDDIRNVPAGTLLNYVVRAVNRREIPGANGGDITGQPVSITVPAD